MHVLVRGVSFIQQLRVAIHQLSSHIVLLFRCVVFVLMSLLLERPRLNAKVSEVGFFSPTRFRLFRHLFPYSYSYSYYYQVSKDLSVGQYTKHTESCILAENSPQNYYQEQRLVVVLL